MKIMFTTGKPIIILLTHGHVDHASGAPEFDCDTYMSPADEPVFQEHRTLEKRKEGLFMVPKEILDQIEESDYIPQRTRPFLPLQAGDTFDLGGITVETYACPGHTPGSVVFLLREERMVLLGDACNFFTFMFFDYCDPIEVYRQTLVKLKAQLAGKYDRILLSHGDGNAPMEIIDNVIQVCDDIMAGQVDDVGKTQPVLICEMLYDQRLPYLNVESTGKSKAKNSIKKVRCNY